MESDDVPVRFRLLLQQSERMLDLQINGLGEELRRTERLIQVGIATIAGTIAVYGLLLNAGVVPDTVFAGLVSLAVLLICGAMIQFLGATTVLGEGKSIHFGPDVLAALAQMEDDPTATDGEHVASMAMMNVRALQNNEQLLIMLNRQRSRGLLLLVLGVFAELLAVGYIGGSRILV